jgi:hypothetical protein
LVYIDIIVIGYVFYPVMFCAQSGLLDETFDDNEMAMILKEEYEWISDMTIQPDDRILMATSDELLRFNNNGNLDDTFVIQGKINIEVENNGWIKGLLLATPENISPLNDLSQQIPSGKLLRGDPFGRNLFKQIPCPSSCGYPYLQLQFP